MSLWRSVFVQRGGGVIRLARGNFEHRNEDIVHKRTFRLSTGGKKDMRETHLWQLSPSLSTWHCQVGAQVLQPSSRKNHRSEIAGSDDTTSWKCREMNWTTLDVRIQRSTFNVRSSARLLGLCVLLPRSTDRLPGSAPKARYTSSSGPH